MAVPGATRALVQAAYQGGMPLAAVADAAGVALSSARRWVKGIPAGTPAAPAAERAAIAELTAALRRIERELAFDPAADAIILPQMAVATSGDFARLRRTIRRAGVGLALLIVAARGLAALMARPSSIARLPAEARDLIARLRADGRTIEEVVARLEEDGLRVSRSALGRYVKRLGEPCPVGTAQEVAALRASVERLTAGLPELRQAVLDVSALHLPVLHGALGRVEAALGTSPPRRRRDAAL